MWVRIAKLSRTGKRRACRLYAVWCCMRKRCRTKTFRDYKFYGGRGIKVCDEWQDYAVFRAWAIANGYGKGLTLERIDNDGDYSPENCRWTTMAEQNRNSSKNILVKFRDRELPVTDWAKRIGMHPVTLFGRLRSGWPVEKALTEPVRKPPR